MAGYETLDDVMAEWNEHRKVLLTKTNENDWSAATILEASIWMDRVRSAALAKKPTARARQALKLEDAPEG